MPRWRTSCPTPSNGSGSWPPGRRSRWTARSRPPPSTSRATSPWPPRPSADALDPLGGAFKAAKALSDLPKVSQVLANVSDHLQIPKTKFPDGALDLSDRYRVDKDGKFIPLDREGKPHLEPAKRELSAAERGVGGGRATANRSAWEDARPEPPPTRATICRRTAATT
ncbi:hypothetical protein [Streptomyces sp. NPDC057557]|uniref:hypothetical protein n=1 Tax=Streptomyces sp. NPDC057557 TaxID=3346167 RepID=UPI0036B15128